jgi:hypothetical protein
MQILHVTSRVGFLRKNPDDLLALAGEALSRLYSREGRMVWQFTEDVTRTRRPPRPGPPPLPSTGPRPAPRPSVQEGYYFRAIASYRAGNSNAVDTWQTQESVRMTCSASRFDQNAQFYSRYSFEFKDAHHGTGAETIVLASCFYMTQMLRERGWINENEAPGLWVLDRPWRDYFITRVLNGGQTELAGFIVCLQNYGLFLSPDSNSAGEAIWIRKLFNV